MRQAGIFEEDRRGNAHLPAEAPLHRCLDIAAGRHRRTCCALGHRLARWRCMRIGGNRQPMAPQTHIFNRYPVLKIQAMIARNTIRNNSVMPRLMPMPTSALP